ncbi:hypothetical protein, partial [uncultured Subdoligranulum sp.]|uniref:hypothetical protein n=1 Tax=uncultured Subdoligranulum sp. TaxID=512298 RepID=UPI0026309E2A
MPDGDSVPLFCSRGVRFVGACPPKRTGLSAFVPSLQRRNRRNSKQKYPEGIFPSGYFYLEFFWFFSCKKRTETLTLSC